MAKKAAKSADSDAIQLPTEANVPPGLITDYSWLIYGDKNVGKSTLASQFPDIVAFMNGEAGRMGLRVPMIPDPKRNEPPLDWERTKKYAKLILEGKPGRVVIDNVDRFGQMCEKYHCDLIGVKAIQDINDHGGMWRKVKEDFRSVWTPLVLSGFKITATSHCRKRPRVTRAYGRDELKQALKDGLIIDQVQPTCAGWVQDWLHEVMEFIGFYTKWGSERVLHIRSGEAILSSPGSLSGERFLQPKGTKNDDKKDVSGQPYQVIPMGRNERDAYKNMALAWDNKLEGWNFDAEDLATYSGD